MVRFYPSLPRVRALAESHIYLGPVALFVTATLLGERLPTLTVTLLVLVVFALMTRRLRSFWQVQHGSYLLESSRLSYIKDGRIESIDLNDVVVTSARGLFGEIYTPRQCGGYCLIELSDGKTSVLVSPTFCPTLAAELSNRHII